MDIYLIAYFIGYWMDVLIWISGECMRDCSDIMDIEYVSGRCEKKETSFLFNLLGAMTAIVDCYFRAPYRGSHKPSLFGKKNCCGLSPAKKQWHL